MRLNLDGEEIHPYYSWEDVQPAKYPQRPSHDVYFLLKRCRSVAPPAFQAILDGVKNAVLVVSSPIKNRLPGNPPKPKPFNLRLAPPRFSQKLIPPLLQLITALSCTLNMHELPSQLRQRLFQVFK
jgi:hypothetical protein